MRDTPFPRVDRRALIDYATILTGVTGRLVIALVYFLIVANGLSLGDFGAFAASSAAGVVLSRLLGFGFISPLYRMAARKPQALGAHAAGLAVLSAASLPLIALLAAAAFTLLFDGRMTPAAFAMIVAAEVVGWRVLEFVAILNNGRGAFGRASVLVVVGSALRTIAAIAFWFAGEGALAFWAALYLASTLAAAAVALLVFLPPMRWRLHLGLTLARWRDATAAATSDLTFYAQAELDKFVVLAIAGTTATGLYAIVFRLIDLTAIPIRSFNQLLVQRLMRRREAGPAGRRVLIEMAIAAASTTALVAGASILAFHPTLLGENVAAAAPILPLLIAVPAFRNLAEYHAELLYAAGLTWRRVALLAGAGALKAAFTGIALLAALGEASPVAAAAPWLNLVFLAAYLLSMALTYRWLAGADRTLPA